jgi:predicted DNA-binding transcriptional regulator YafY
VPLPETYEDPGEFDVVAHVTESLAAVPYAHEVEVVLATTLAEARRRIPPTVGRLTETDGGVLLRTRAERLDGMARMLAGLGHRFSVRRPDELRDAVRELGESLIRSVTD